MGYEFRLPFGDGKYPCPICHKPDFCSRHHAGILIVCRRVSDGAFKHEADINGADYWLHKVAGATSVKERPATSKIPTRELPMSHDLDRAYRGLLARLPLDEHRNDLINRGLSHSDIVRAEYRTLAVSGRSKVATILVDELGERIGSRIPGIFLNRKFDKPFWTIAGPPGLLIPVRNFAGLIVGIKVRRSLSENEIGNKYVYLSSKSKDGCGPGAPVHVPILASRDFEPGTLRVTEGELKADVATARTKLLTISIAGVANWRSGIAVVQKLNAKKIILAFDNDFWTNPLVARAMISFNKCLKDLKISREVELWPST